jgi:hypothetical protein
MTCPNCTTAEHVARHYDWLLRSADDAAIEAGVHTGENLPPHVYIATMAQQAQFLKEGLEAAKRGRDEAREEIRTTLLADEERRKLTGDALAAEAESERLRTEVRRIADSLDDGGGPWNGKSVAEALRAALAAKAGAMEPLPPPGACDRCKGPKPPGVGYCWSCHHEIMRTLVREPCTAPNCPEHGAVAESETPAITDRSGATGQILTSSRTPPPEHTAPLTSLPE